MRRFLVVMAIMAFSTYTSAQEKVQQEKPKQEQTAKPAEQPVKKSNEDDFQTKKAQEAKEKQEAMRKAMKEKAKSKEQVERSR